MSPMLAAALVKAEQAELSFSTNDKPHALIMAAQALVADIAHGRVIDAAVLRAAMESAFGASDAQGAWSWKDAYEAVEAAQVLFLRRYGAAIKARAQSEPSRVLTMLSKIGALLPTQTRRSEESHALQQFSTTLEFAYVASLAAGVGLADVVLEPSAGTGMLAIFAELAGAKLVLNEWAETRAGLLKLLFPGAPISRFDGAQIHDRLDPDLRPSVVAMNPPFSASPLIEGRHAAAIFEHIRAALSRLEAGGRLVAITGESFSPTSPAWRAGFERLQEKGKLVFTASLGRGFFARHGTSVEARLSVFDKTPAEHPTRFVEGRGPIETLEELLALVLREVPPRVALSRNDHDASPALSQRVAPPSMSRWFTPRGLGRPDHSRFGASGSVRRSARMAASRPLRRTPLRILTFRMRTCARGCASCQPVGGLTDARMINPNITRRRGISLKS